MGRKRLLWRLYPTYLAIALVSLLVVVWWGSASLSSWYQKQRTEDLERFARLVAAQVVNERLLDKGAGAADALCREAHAATGIRFTVIRFPGEVVGESTRESAGMEDHRGRPEIHAALSEGRGSSIRYSDTVHEELLYVAVRVPGEGPPAFVRTAMSVRAVSGMAETIVTRLLLACAAIAVICIAGSLLLARRFVKPLEAMRRAAERIAAGDLASRLPPHETAEIGGLAEALNQMAAQLDERIGTVTRQSHEQEAILSSMVEGVMAVDADERVISMNHSARQMLGVSVAAVEGKSIQEVVRNGQLQQFVARAIAGPSPVEEEIVLRGSGTNYLQLHGTILSDATHQAIGAVIVLNDISRLRRLETMRTEFVANVSHELRTPITSIKGFVETLLDGAMRNPEDAARFLGVIAKQVERLSAIIDDLLALSRVEQEGQTAIVTQPQNLLEILDDARAVCALKAEEKQIPIRVECPADLVIRMNPALLEQAVVNLIDNAVKYSEPGSPVEVRAVRTEDGVTIEVADCGCGIGREHLPRLFERFYRVDKARSRKLGGTGLGLAIVKHIVQAHGGQIGVASTLGKGSTFTIRLPGEAGDDKVTR